MFLRKSSLFLLVAFLLIGCGGSSATQTPSATNTPVPTPTMVTEIPAPPDSAQVQQGEDPIVDTLTSSVGSAVDPVAAEEGMTISNTTTYKSTAAFDDIVNFYKTEMTSRGWTEETAENQSGAAVLGYVSGDNGAIILIMDGTSFGSDTIIMTMNMSK